MFLRTLEMLLTSRNDRYIFDNINKALNICYSYEKLVLAGDFNVSEKETLPETFLYEFEFAKIQII